MTARATITLVTSVPPRFVLVLQLRAGEIEPGQLLTTGETRLRVDGLAFTPADAWQKGLRGATVTILSGPAPTAGADIVQCDEERR